MARTGRVADPAPTRGEREPVLIGGYGQGMAERSLGTRVVLIRHGESVVTVNRVVGGPLTCTGLSDLGRAQATRLRDRLADSGELVVDGGLTLYSSGYPRARETAEIIAPALRAEKVAVDEAFGEQDPGPDCDGLTYEEFIERHGRPQWDLNPYGVS